MPSPFAITAATNSVRLNAARRGEAAFTVFNSSGRPIRGRARLVPENPAAAAWLTLEGNAERDFAIAGTEQYTVQIVVPPDAPAGSYPFRLDAVGVENPDEDYTAGPTVTFVVPEPEPQKRPFPWWVLLVVLGVLVVCCLAACGLVVGLWSCGGGLPTARSTEADLVGKTWVLKSYMNSSGNLVNALANPKATAKFGGGKVSGSGSCNSYSGSYQANEDNLKVTEIQMTLMLCTGAGIMEQEQQYLTNLRAAASFRVTGDQLEIANSAGKTVLVFTVQ